MHHHHRRCAAFTIVELLVVVSIMGILLGVLLPAVAKARDQSRRTASESNLRNLGTAHATYASEWQGRQLTLAVDDIVRYGLDFGDPDDPTPPSSPADPKECADQFAVARAAPEPPTDLDYPPGIQLGWCTNQQSGEYLLWAMPFTDQQPTNYPLMAPMIFQSGPSERFGWFRIPNCRQFTTYLNDRFYDPVFYAPKDEAVMDFVEPGLDSPEEFVPTGAAGGNQMARVGWSSYSMSAAALFGTEVFRHDPDTGASWRDPWLQPAGMRTPSMSQAKYASLKSHMLEHHWLQSRRTECNPGFPDGTYGGCEPYYFNHGWESTPATLFYDGHVGSIGVREAEQADSRAENQSGVGLWSRDTPWGEDGYFINFGYDFANTSFHLLTVDGIGGRDTVSN